MRKIEVILITLVLCLSGCGNGKDNQVIREEIIDGVRIIHNLEILADASESPIQFVEDLIIGNDESNENYMFNYPVDIEADQDGNIFILDWRDCVIKKYNSQGEYIKTWGGKGQGPGEFSGPVSLLINENNQLMVAEPMGRKMEVFNLDGGHIRSIKSEYRTDQISRGNERMPIIGFSISREDVYNVGFYSIDTSEFIQFFSKEQPGFRVIQNNEFTYEYPFFVRWAINSKNNVYIGSPDDYMISVFNPKGELMFKFTKPFSYIYLSGEELESVINTIERLNQDRDSYKRMPYPVFNYISIDEKDRVWIEHYQPKWQNRVQKETRYDVFSPKGIFLFTAKINGHIYREIVFKNGHAYVLKKQESGYTHAVRFQIVESN